MSIRAPISTGLEVRDLRLVVALTAAGTTARAAEALHLAQPTVSRALLSLEDRLGTRLFNRRSRGLVPTEACLDLAREGALLLGEIRALERRTRQPQGRSRIRLVCECYTAYHWLPSTLIALEDEMPDVELALRVQHTSDAVEALDAGEIDAALITSPFKSNDTFRVGRLFTDELVFVVGASHPLAAKKALAPKDLQQHRLFTSRATPHEVRSFMSQAFGRARPRLDVSLIPLTEAIVDLARAGLGIGILTDWIVTPYLARNDLVRMRLAKGPIRRTWKLVWRRSLGAAGPRLLTALKATKAA